LPLPALLTIQSGAAKLRYATLMGIKKAKSKEIKRIESEKSAAASSVKLERIYLPQKSKRSQIFEGTPQETAAQLIDKLRFEARVL
jgi:electron transfer flavoprotein beta subunit